MTIADADRLNKDYNICHQKTVSKNQKKKPTKSGASKPTPGSTKPNPAKKQSKKSKVGADG